MLLSVILPGSTLGERAAWAIVTAALVLPAVPIGVSWRRMAKAPALGVLVHPAARSVLVLVTCSQVLLMLGLAARDVVGPDYSTQRSVTIIVNLILMAAATMVALARGGPLRWPLTVSSAWVTTSWFYMLAMSAVV